MTGRSTGESGVGRFRRALAGVRVEPPVTGVTFLDLSLLPGEGPSGPAEYVAELSHDEGLDFAFVEARAPWSLRAVAALRDAGVAGAWVVDGILWTALQSGGIAEGLRIVASSPGALAPALDAALVSALMVARRGIGAGAPALVVADDMAGAAGPLVDPAFLNEAVFPRMARIVELASEAGIPAILHCDGDARSLMAAAAAAGFVAIHGDAGGAAGIERSIAAARAAGLAFIGGVPTVELSGADAPAPALARARALAHAFAGGLLFADDGGITTSAEADALFGVLAGVRESFG